jgi:TetR/AcrR family transcriptional regulator
MARTVPEGIARKLQSASGLFARQGVEATKMADLAEATGVPKATLYYYFEGKEAILGHLFGQVLAELGGAVHAAAATEGNAAERLERVFRAHLEVIARNPDASLALQFDLGRAARMPEVAAASESSFIRPVSALLEAGARDGSLRPVEHPRLAAVAILGAVVTIGVNTLGSDPGRPVEGPLQTVTALLLDGLRAAPLSTQARNRSTRRVRA